ncbi:SCO family protein [Aromatoleum evansii]|uniref:SCO family protein n=1 Tax=Aromatoleum evansii TaxID=59406 RepID=A0ABZ1ASI3_AROEV|nr:SCO family protein [Aromatoleum evansii]
MRTVIACVLILLLGLAAFSQVSAGFRVVTSEAARRLAVREHPPLMPDVGLVDARFTRDSLRADLVADGRIALVDFIYTRCESVCRVLGNEFQQLQQAILEQGLQERLRLISISFDPTHDNPDALARYASQMQAAPAVWRIATVADVRELRPLLEAFGVVVVPDGTGGFVHNAAIHTLRADGRLTRIDDLGAVGSALRAAAARSGERAQ